MVTEELPWCAKHTGTETALIVNGSLRLDTSRFTVICTWTLSLDGVFVLSRNNDLSSGGNSLKHYKTLLSKGDLHIYNEIFTLYSP